jgi:hypothetical protein
MDHTEEDGDGDGVEDEDDDADDDLPEEFGWPDALFVAPVDELFRCPICACVLRDAVQCGAQHCFCQPCLMRALAEKSACPLCREVLEPAEVQPNRMVRAMVERLTVRCAHARRGCTTEVAISSWESHVAQCVFRRTECPNAGCAARVRLYQLQAHVSTCRYARIICPGCGEDFPKIERKGHSCIEHLKRLVLTMQSKLSLQDSQLAQVQHSNAQLEARVRDLEDKVQTARNSARRIASIGMAATGPRPCVGGNVEKGVEVRLEAAWGGVTGLGWEKRG